MLFKAEAIPPLKLFSIPLNLLQKGISTITIIDNEGRPLAEQLFFAHYNNQLTASIKTEKAVYGKQDSVKVKLKLNDSAGKPISGILSVAVVQGNRLTSSFQSIDSYFYLNQLLGNLPQDPSGSGFHNKDYLEHILLTKGWRRYTWQDVISSTVKDTIQLYAGMPIKGSVTSNNKPLKAPVSIVALGGSNLGLITTQKDGSFILDESQLLTESDKKILFKISGNNNYKIHINDPYVTLNQKLAQQLEVNNTDAISNNLNSADQELKGLQKNIILQAVEIKANRGSSSIRGFKGEPGTNSCGDYVDEYDYLNYEYSENRYKPIVGKLYKKRTDLRGGRVWFKVDPVYYFSCINEDNSRNLIISGIYNGKEYYGKMTDGSGLQYQSTLYWQSGLVTTDTGEAEFVFKTGDIADTFKIVVQGITNNGVVAGINTFTIK